MWYSTGSAPECILAKQCNKRAKPLCKEEAEMKAGDVMCYRCFGLLISPGRNVKHSDMQLIELVSGGIELVSCGIFWRLGEPLPVFLSGLFVGLSGCQSLCLFLRG